MRNDSKELKTETKDTEREIPQVTMRAIEQAVKEVRHGVVQLIIQDGRIVQIDKTEKMRLV